MTPLGIITVLAAGAWWFAWRDVFHAAIGLPTVMLVVLGVLIAARRHRSALRDDPDAILEDAGPGPLGKLLRGLASGGALVVVLQIVFTLAARTPLYRIFVDTGTEKVLTELDVLERHGQWLAIAERLATLPATRTASARALLVDRKVNALIKVAEDTEDLAAACDLYRVAERVTRDERRDARLVNAKLEWCNARTARRPLPANARADIARMERLGPDSLRIEVRVMDEAGRAIAGLVAEDFAVTAGGRPLKVAAVSTQASTAGPGTRLSIVVDQSAEARSDSILTAAYLVAGLSPADSVEVVACGASARVEVARTDDPFVALRSLLRLSATAGCATADSVWLALDRLGGGPRRAAILIARAPVTGSVRSLPDLVERLGSAGIPVFVVPLGPVDEGLRLLATRSGGRIFEPERRDQRELLRARARSLPGSSPLAYVLVCTGVATSEGRLDLRVGGTNAATATTRF